MIRKIRIEGYKCFDDTSFPCSELTLLTGDNLSGKTAVIESLLLCRQISDTNLDDALNGPFVTVGKYEDVVNKNINAEAIRITLLDSSNQGCQSFVNNNHRGSMTSFGDEARFAFPTTMLRVLPEKTISTTRDELAENDIAAMKYWVARVTGGIEIKYKHESVCYSVNGCDISQNDLSFGIRNAVGAILACLYVPDGSVIFIENPEAGLHPRAQAELAKFLYFVANSGKQVFVETHSDHILNALRVGVTSKEMTPARIAINYLVKDKEKGNCQCNPVRIEENGDLHGENNSMSLDGFFDQYSKDLDEMLGL